MKRLDVKSISPYKHHNTRRDVCEENMHVDSYRLACVAGGIVSACNVLAEELRSRAKNGEETL